MVNQYPGARTEMITFGDRVSAFLAVPETGSGPFPAVILGHERYGLVQHTLDLTGKFARYGMVGIAPDLFSRWDGDKAALNRGEISVPISDADIRDYMGASLDYLLADPRVNARRIAAMGVCQSGAYPLVLNSVRPEIYANIVFYGGAQDREWQVNERRTETYESILERVSAPILGVWGEADNVVSLDDVRHLRNVLEDKCKSYEFLVYRDMPHGWLNDTMPGRYRPAQAEHAWNQILTFLRHVADGMYPPDRAIWRMQSDIALDYDFTKNVRWE
jgi:carboxymethylenebutenolidase